jgi:hypothetical protein
MSKQRVESYSALSAPPAPCCVVTDCGESVVAEVYSADYSLALGMFRNRKRATRSRRVGDERFYVCRFHLDNDPRMRPLRWQELFVF